jgi:membrane protease YdiL (CAAX protease family)
VAEAIRTRELVALATALVLLIAWNLGRGVIVTGRPQIIANASMGLVFAGVGLLGGIGISGLGLRRSTMLRGLAYGAVAFAAVFVVLVIVGAIPATSGALNDDRVHVGAARMLFEALVAIPIGTVVLEEVAFRGTVLGLLRARLRDVPAAAVTSVLFGLWHVYPIRHHSIGAIIGTVLATTLAGAGFAWLRIRSDSLIAPAMAHVATNSLAFAVAWAYWH